MFHKHREEEEEDGQFRDLGVNSGAWPAHCSLFAAEKHALVIGHLGEHHNTISEYMKMSFDTQAMEELNTLVFFGLGKGGYDQDLPVRGN